LKIIRCVGATSVALEKLNAPAGKAISRRNPKSSFCPVPKILTCRTSVNANANRRSVPPRATLTIKCAPVPPLAGNIATDTVTPSELLTPRGKTALRITSVDPERRTVATSPVPVK